MSSLADDLRYVPRLSAEATSEALRQNHALWGMSRTVDEHVAYGIEQLDRAGPELLRYVGLIDQQGSVVASIKRYGLAVVDAHGAEHRAVGIGAVFTRDDRRKQGFAARLVGEVKREAEDLGYRAALLYSDIDPAYYARLGFVALDASEHEAARDDLEGDPLEVRPAHAEEIDAILAWRDAGFAGLGLLRMARSRATFRYFAWRNRVHGVYVLRGDDHRDVGYLLATRDDPMRDLPDAVGDALFIDEWSALSVPRDRVLATARELARHAGVTRVRAWLRGDQAQAPFVARPRREAVPMIAPLGGFSFDPARAFLGAFEHF